MGWTKFVCCNLIEDPNDCETTIRKIQADILKKRLTFVKFYKAELYIDEVDNI
ncbi:hypothetical protein NGTWS0302_05280 [Mycolicibacterium cyprinidarum]|uniref:Uncharacterized protein n=1 Tax=Mycolicibacterium cyprinidarum TaxID=2860311 RepID=A0ABQ4V6G0_9MYCO|nr:hypothetical protein NGTWS1702_37190 [Mycolicibacterium sp. NGTWSNA01]GJF13847.1 hypothetical protein NGTWS0302_05280 [Mycolicibacterium sp. NGTWS0302]